MNGLSPSGTWLGPTKSYAVRVTLLCSIPSPVSLLQNPPTMYLNKRLFALSKPRSTHKAVFSIFQSTVFLWVPYASLLKFTPPPKGTQALALERADENRIGNQQNTAICMFDTVLPRAQRPNLTAFRRFFACHPSPPPFPLGFGEGFVQEWFGRPSPKPQRGEPKQNRIQRYKDPLQWWSQTPILPCQISLKKRLKGRPNAGQSVTY